MTDNEIIKGLECCVIKDCGNCPVNHIGFCVDDAMKEALALINRQKAEIERLQECPKCVYAYDGETMEYCVEGPCPNFKTAAEIRAEAVKEFAEKVDELLKRYSHLHKYAEEARRTEEEYADGTPMEMVSVWEVLTLKKWEMCDYETMNTLQHNIEVIEKARLLSEIEHDFELLKKEMVGADNG